MNSRIDLCLRRVRLDSRPHERPKTLTCRYLVCSDSVRILYGADIRTASIVYDRFGHGLQVSRDADPTAFITEGFYPIPKL